MLTILFRTIIVYALLIGTMRLMGKRQLGELEISELVTTLLISEIAAVPIENPNIPIVYFAIPLITILTLEVFLSVILLKCPRLKSWVSARPSVLIRHGQMDQKELQRIRISLDELISEIRQSGIASVEDVDYAILEQNGKLSIIPRRRAQPPDAATLGLEVQESGISHILVADGRINYYNMNLLNVSDRELQRLLRQSKLTLPEVFLLSMDDTKNHYIIKKEENP